MLDPIVRVLEQALNVLRGVSGSYLAAIVLLTFAIKLVLHPLTRKQLNSMKAMQALAPQMEVLRRKYKDNPRQLNAEVMGLYRANRVNPFSGCLPLILQMPVLLALYRLMVKPDIFKGEPLFGVALERAPSLELMTQHPLLILIPVLSGLSVYYQQRLSITDPQQATMLIFMPFLLAFFSTQFPIGLSVYWIVSTTLYIVEYVAVVGRPRRMGTAPPRRRRRASERAGESAERR